MASKIKIGVRIKGEQRGQFGNAQLMYTSQQANPIECGQIIYVTDETCRELLALLTPFKIGMLTTDERGSYARELLKERHLTDKILTQRIERNKLTLRTRIKRLDCRTIRFSRSVELREKVIGTFIEKHMFY